MIEEKDFSVVIPAFQAIDTVGILVSRLGEVFKSSGWTYEIILVDDGSTDNTWEKIISLSSTNQNLKGIKFSRNYGQHNAIFAGLKNVIGNWIIVMDCDLQDRPEEIPKLFSQAQKGYNIVVGQRLVRQDKSSKIKTSRFFYKIFEFFSGLKFEPGVGNFGIYEKKVIGAVLQYREHFKPFAIIVKTLGFSRSTIEVEHGARHSGKSNYNGLILFKGGINTILYYSNKPVWFFVIGGMGAVIFLSFLLTGLIFLTLNLSVHYLVIILIVLMSFVSLNVAMIGVYVSRIFLEIKRRPNYVIDEQF